MQITTEVINVIRKQLGSRVESFLRLYSSSIASQICGTFTAQLRHRDAAIPRLVFGGSLRRREWQWCRKSSHDDVGHSGWSSSNGTSLCAFSVVYQPTVPTYYLSAYLLTYLHTYTHILRSCGEPKPASIARICITRTCLSIALPRLASSPRLLPSHTAKRRNEKKTLDHLRLFPPRSQWRTRDPTTLVSRCIMFTLASHRGLLL